jgi:AGZA family xanthine/uracil permease-like MFS transporter
MEKFFKLKEHGTNVRTELIAGFTTFMTMAYILAINPDILSKAGMDSGALFTATALASLLATLMMGLYANLPFALAPGMGLNAFFAFTVCGIMKMPWQLALTAILIEGIIFLVLSIFKVREAIVKAIPANIRKSVSVGIGLFIAFIGLQHADIIVDNPATLVSVGDIAGGTGLLAIIGLFITSALLFFKIKGALLIGILATTLIGIPFGITKIPEEFSPVSLPASLEPIFFKFQFDKIFTLEFVVVIFSFLFVDMFDTIGTLIGVSTKAKMLDSNGTMPGMNKALLTDAVGTTFGAVVGTSTVTTYVESAAGVSEGGRTGLTAVATAGLFAIALFLSPIFLLIPEAATAPALILVGLFMMEPIKEIDLSDYTEAIPAFLAIIMMPLTYSIAEGIMFGIVSYAILKLITLKLKDVPIVTWILAALFLAKIIVDKVT